MRRLLITLLCLIPLVAACASETGDETTSTTSGTTSPPTEPTASGEPDEVDDVTIAGTRVDAAGWMVVDLQLTNDSSAASSYYIQVDLLDAAGTKIADGIAGVTDVQSGTTVTATASSLQEPPANGVFTARLVSVDRLAS